MSFCDICYMDANLRKIGECGHKFCAVCNQRCLEEDVKCPLCRQSIRRNPSFFHSAKHLFRLSKLLGI
jgi:hypothetical protein